MKNDLLVYLNKIISTVKFGSSRQKIRCFTCLDAFFTGITGTRSFSITITSAQAKDLIIFTVSDMPLHNNNTN